MSGKLDEIYMLGREAFDAGETDQALEHFLEVIKHRPYADVYNKMGLIYHGKGQFGKSVAAFRKALEINPSYTEASLNLAITLNDMGRYEEASEVFAKASKIAHSGPYSLDPFIKGKLANEHAKIGDIYFDLALYGEALEEYKKATKLRPTFVDIITKIGVTYREKGLYNEAIREFMRAKEIHPQFIPARINLGVTYYMKGFLDMAIKEWNDSLTVDPDNEEAKMYLKFIQAEYHDREAGSRPMLDLDKELGIKPPGDE